MGRAAHCAGFCLPEGASVVLATLPVEGCAEHDALLHPAVEWMQARGAAAATFFAGVIRVFEQMTDALDFHGRGLQLRASRQETISSNIANADTPNFKARDFDFGAALREANGMAPADSGMREALPAAEGGLPTVALARTHRGHRAMGMGAMHNGQPELKYVNPEQPSMDGNTVDLNRERAQFSQNAVGYEASLRFLNGRIRTMMTAIRGE